MQDPLFTIILDVYYKPHFLKLAVEAIFRQTYKNLEIILINNGATEETIECLYEFEKIDERVKLIHFKENQYSPEDPLKMIAVCLNEALQAATGEYVFYQSYDDLLADDYAEKMIQLFQENPDCTTAAGISVSIDADGKLLETIALNQQGNCRPRYMPGHLLANSSMQGDSVFSAPGTIFTIKRDVLIKSGGYHRSIELSQFYGIMPFGVTGFDETAVLHWRRHIDQLNLQLSAKGWLGIDETFSLLKDWDIQGRWEGAFGKSNANMIVGGIKKSMIQQMAIFVVVNLYALRPLGAIRIFPKAWTYPSFWGLLPWAFWNRSGTLILIPRKVAKIVVRLIIKTFPGIVAHPYFAMLDKKVNPRSQST
jgi:hypothetical protein